MHPGACKWQSTGLGEGRQEGAAEENRIRGGSRQQQRRAEAAVRAQTGVSARLNAREAERGEELGGVVLRGKEEADSGRRRQRQRRQHPQAATGAQSLRESAAVQSAPASAPEQSS